MLKKLLLFIPIFSSIFILNHSKENISSRLFIDIPNYCKYIRPIDGSHVNPNPNKFINSLTHIQPVGGLCNKIRVIMSYLFASIRNNETLHVYWVPDKDCQSKFKDLFLEPPKDLIVIHDEEMPPTNKTFTCYIYVPESIDYNYMIEKIMEDIIPIIFVPKPEI